MSNKLQEGDVRTTLVHEIKNGGWFNLELNDGNEITVYSERHTLEMVEEIYYGEDDWERGCICVW